jgi:hypothetical protein
VNESASGMAALGACKLSALALDSSPDSGNGQACPVTSRNRGVMLTALNRYSLPPTASR